MTKAPKKRQQELPEARLDDAPAPASAEADERLAGPADAAKSARAAKKVRLRTTKPLPKGAPKKAKGVKASKKRKQRAPAAEPVSVPTATGHEDRLARLAMAVQAVHDGKHVSSRTAKLLAGGVPKMAQKLMEEAAETAIDAVLQERAGFVNESADLLYNLVVLWSALGVTPNEVWAEMDRHAALLGMAEKLPKLDDAAG